MLLVVLTYLLQLRIIVGNPFPLHLTISTAPLPLFVHLYNKAPPFPVFSPPTTAGLYPVIRWKEDHIVSVGCLALNPRNAFVHLLSKVNGYTFREWKHVLKYQRHYRCEYSSLSPSVLCPYTKDSFHILHSGGLISCRTAHCDDTSSQPARTRTSTERHTRTLAANDKQVSSE